VEDYLGQIQAANDAGLYYLALAASLTLPDICGAMEAEDGRATAGRYQAWFDEWPGRHFFGVFSGDDCWRFRCDFLHQGLTGSERGRYARIVFVEPGATTNVFHCNVIHDALNIDVTIFCREMVRSTIEWLRAVDDSDLVQANLGRFVRRYPEGLPPYFRGVPIIS